MAAIGSRWKLCGPCSRRSPDSDSNPIHALTLSMTLTLMEVENNRTGMCVVLCGYKDKMTRLKRADPGLARRFPLEMRPPRRRLWRRLCRGGRLDGVRGTDDDDRATEGRRPVLLLRCLWLLVRGGRTPDACAPRRRV